MKPSNDKEAITLILEGLAAKGYHPYEVADDTWNLSDRTDVTTVDEAVELATGVDEAYVFVTTPENGEGWIRFILGNHPEEVANDYTVNLDPDLSNIIEPWWN